MHFDRLDEIYAMVKSNLQFEKVVLAGLTSLDDTSNWSAQIVQQMLTVPILGINNREYAQTSRTLGLNLSSIHLRCNSGSH